LRTALHAQRLARRGSTYAWDEKVDTWEHVCSSPAFERLAERIEKLAAPCADDRVLDLGAGTGLLALRLASKVATVVAVDASAAMLERLADRARRERAPNVHTLVADLRSVPLPDESATLAVSNYAFHHLDDAGKELALAEVRRVLVPGGRLVVCDMMFSLSLAPRDRRVVRAKVASLARRGPAGLVRITRNALRLASGRWEQPAPVERWERMLSDRHFDAIHVFELEHEGGIALARRPERAVA
jgi:SAM-dependent methyltransferase